MPKPVSRSSSRYIAHRRWTPDDAKAALASLEASGLTLGAFARREGLDPQRLSRWRRQLPSSIAGPAFEEIARTVPVETPAGAEHGIFEVVLPSGRVVRVPASFEADALRRLLEVVDEVRAC